jgi:microcystin-dependent protein
MASPPTVSNIFIPNTVAESGQVNENFSDLISWITANAVQRDGSVAFTGIPLLPSTMPSNANHAVRKGYVDSVVGDVAGVVFPVGSVIDYVGVSAPEGWALLNGQVLTNAESLFPQLWATVPVAWRSGSNIVLPNAAGRVSVGFDSSVSLFNAVGKTGGSRNSVVVSHNHTGAASDSGSLSMSGTTDTTGFHQHQQYVRQHEARLFPSTGTSKQTAMATIQILPELTLGSGTHSHNVFTSGGSHGHSVSIASAGESGVDKNLQPFITLNKIIKVG